MTFKVFLKELATWAILLGLGWGGCMLTHPKNVKLPFQSTDTGKSSIGTGRGYRALPAPLGLRSYQCSCDAPTAWFAV